jgi:N-acetylmuramoyl-L-alanine amidase
LNSSFKRVAGLFAALAFAVAVAFLGHAELSSGSPAPPNLAINRNLVVLDPAHGGPDAGATLAGPASEKDVTLALASHLRAALAAAGFTVISTRDTDPPAVLTNDQRADIVNRTHPLVCIVLHATAVGSGVHMYTSTLPPPGQQATAAESPDIPPPFLPTPWDEAQAPWVSQSLQLAAELASALGNADLPVSSDRAALRPLDNLTCPAVAVELAPLMSAGADATPVTDPVYQQRIAATLATALRALRDHPGQPAPSALGAPQ